MGTLVLVVQASSRLVRLLIFRPMPCECGTLLSVCVCISSSFHVLYLYELDKFDKSWQAKELCQLLLFVFGDFCSCMSLMPTISQSGLDASFVAPVGLPNYLKVS